MSSYGYAPMPIGHTNTVGIVEIHGWINPVPSEFEDALYQSRHQPTVPTIGYLMTQFFIMREEHLVLYNSIFITAGVLVVLWTIYRSRRKVPC